MDQIRVAWVLLAGAVGLGLVGACARGSDLDPSNAGGAGVGSAATTGSTGVGGAATTGSTGSTSSTTSGPTTSTGTTSVTSSTSSSSGTGGADAGVDGGGNQDASGSGGSGGGPIDGGPVTIVFSDDFESDTLGTQASGWTRYGGSMGDWAVVVDGTQVFAQHGSSSSTLRTCIAGPVLATAATVSAKVKITALGTSGTTTAMVCVRHPSGSGTPYACLALEAQAGARIQTGVTDGPLWPATVSVGTWYGVKLAVDTSGVLTAYLDNVLLGTFTPSTAINSGSVAIKTRSAQVEFDDIVLTKP